MPDEEKNEDKASLDDSKATQAPSKKNNPESKKRQNEGNNNKKKGNWSKRSKKEKQNDEGSNEKQDGYTRNFGSNKTEIHAGSYANPAMRAMFGVTLPPHLIPPSREEKIEESQSTGEVTPRAFSKRKVAFLLAYIGTGYAGFQANEGQRTLQGEFELALLKSELLNPLNFGFFWKYSWSTSGRTDKGVHACAQVCSAKIQILPDQTFDDVRGLINQHLPDHFRVLDVIKTSKSFCAKTGRSRVRYQYMIPAFCFWGRKELRELMTKVAPLDKKGRTPAGGTPLSEDEILAIKDQVKNYRVGPGQLEALQKALRQYEGTHSFHNFTNKLTAKDASATRYIVSFNVEDPMIFESGMQWVPTQVVGQSFLIHQIRKMVSVAVDSVRLELPDLITRALDKESKLRTDLAPAQGLFMEMSFYDGYNQRIQPPSDLKELKWHQEETDAFKRWKKFRNEVLMDHIVKEEHREGNFLQHLYLHEFFFDFNENYCLDQGEAKAAEGEGKTEAEGKSEETEAADTA